MGKSSKKRREEYLEEVEEKAVEVGGKKNDQGKLRYDLDSVCATEDRVAVLTHGAEKYGDRNWEAGINYSRIYAAIQRHLTAFWGGEDFDEESGYHHLAHASCELMFLQHFENHPELYAEFDDRPRSDDRLEEEE